MRLHQNTPAWVPPPQPHPLAGRTTAWLRVPRPPPASFSRASLLRDLLVLPFKTPDTANSHISTSQPLSHGQRSLAGVSPQGSKEPDMTEYAHGSHFTKPSAFPRLRRAGATSPRAPPLGCLTGTSDVRSPKTDFHFYPPSSHPFRILQLWKCVAAQPRCTDMRTLPRTASGSLPTAQGAQLGAPLTWKGG